MGYLTFYALMCVALGLWGIWILMKWRELPTFSKAVYDSMREKKLLSDRVSQEDFKEIFIRTEARADAHVAAHRHFLVQLLIADLSIGLKDEAIAEIESKMTSSEFRRSRSHGASFAKVSRAIQSPTPPNTSATDGRTQAPAPASLVGSEK